MRMKREIYSGSNRQVEVLKLKHTYVMREGFAVQSFPYLHQLQLFSHYWCIPTQTLPPLYSQYSSIPLGTNIVYPPNAIIVYLFLIFLFLTLCSWKRKSQQNFKKLNTVIEMVITLGRWYAWMKNMATNCDKIEFPQKKMQHLSNVCNCRHYIIKGVGLGMASLTHLYLWVAIIIPSPLPMGQ